MAAPDVGILTQRLYDRLPELYRAADEALDWPLLRFLSGPLDQASEVEELLDDLDPTVDGTSGLVDPVLAESAWLPWLGQLVGITAPRAPTSLNAPYGELSILFATYADMTAAHPTYASLMEATSTATGGELDAAELRASIASASGGWRSGSHDALVELVEAFLTDTRTVKVVPHHGGNPWVTRVHTYESETPEPWRIERAILLSGQKPAGYDLAHELIAGATYAELTAEFDTYADLSAAFDTYEDARTHVPTA